MVWCKFTDKPCSITSWFPESKEVRATIHVVPNACLPFSLTLSYLCLEIKIPSFQMQPDRYFQWNQLRQSSLSKRASQVAQWVKNPPAMQETQVPSLGWEDHLEKEIATHSSTIAGRIPWTEEPGRLQDMGLQRHNLTEHVYALPKNSGYPGWVVGSYLPPVQTIKVCITYR